MRFSDTRAGGMSIPRRIAAGEPPGSPRELAYCLAHLARRVQQAMLATGPLSSPYPGDDADTLAQTVVYGLVARHVMEGMGEQQHTHSSLFAALDAACEQVARTNDGAAALAACHDLLAHTDIDAVLAPPRQHDDEIPLPHDPLTSCYETFLADCNPALRHVRGVYFTPMPVVSYIVRSVNHLLRYCFPSLQDSAGLAGLASRQVSIFDPAAGTATFLCAVVQHIAQQVAASNNESNESNESSQSVAHVLTALLPRLVGYELLPAPCLVGHLRLHRLLRQHGVSDDSLPHLRLLQRDTLAGPPDVLPDTGGPLVVIGNPPYANYGQRNRGTWMASLLDDYKRGLNERKINLDDDAIKFLRYGQWCIEQAGQGILAFVTSHTFLEGLTHRRVRESLRETFNQVFVLDLHGSALRGEVGPDGSRDDNVFDIRQGVCIGLFVRTAAPGGSARVQHAEVWGTRHDKYAFLHTHDIASTPWQELAPRPPYLFFVPHEPGCDGHVERDYHRYHALTDIFCTCRGGIKTDRDRLFIDTDRTALEERMQTFYTDAGLSPDFRATYRVENSSSYAIEERRRHTSFRPDALYRCLYRPFDVRWLYYDPGGLTSRPASEVMQHMWRGPNLALLVSRQQATSGFAHVWCADTLVESQAVSIKTREGTFVLPLYQYAHHAHHEPGEDQTQPQPQPNLSPAFIRTLEQHTGLQFVPHGRGDLHTTIGPEDVLHMCYALLHSPSYRHRYAAMLKTGFPRVPLPDTPAQCAALASIGAALVDLHLLRMPGSGSGGRVGGNGGAAVLCDPAQQGVVAHGLCDGPVGRVRYDAHRACVLVGKHGRVTGVEPPVWDMQVGSYRPLATWLNARRGCMLTPNDVVHYERVVVALRETRRLMSEIESLESQERRTDTG